MSGMGKKEIVPLAAMAAAAAAIYFTGGAATPAVLGAAEGAAGAGAAGAGAAAAEGAAAAGAAGAAGANVGAGALTAGEMAALGGVEGANVGAGGLLAADTGAGLIGANEGAAAMGMLGANEGAAGLLGSAMPETVATGFEVGGPGAGYAAEMGSGGPATFGDKVATAWGNATSGGGLERASKTAKLGMQMQGLLSPQQQRPLQAPQAPRIRPFTPLQSQPLYTDVDAEKRKQYEAWLAQQQQGRGYYG